MTPTAPVALKRWLDAGTVLHVSLGSASPPRAPRMLKRAEMDGHKVVHEFIVLRHEWEGDGYGWMTEDTRVWLTNHGSEPYPVEGSALLERMEQALSSVVGLRKALSLMVDSSNARAAAADVAEP